MGTNTFHLLLAVEGETGQYIIVHRERIAVKIGKGGINEGYITLEGIERALVAMQHFKSEIDRQGVTNVYAFGTSALRNAKNSADVLDKIKLKTGIQAAVISGDMEAELIYHGVKYSLDMSNEPSLIVDIGGGSVECILGNDTEIFWKESFEIGAQRLLEKFHKNDPITIQEIQNLNDHFETKLGPLISALQRHPTRVLIGASGAFDTFSDMYCYKNDITKHEEQPETPLTLEGFYEIHKELTRKNREERLSIPGMIEMRVDMIVVACCLVHYILSKHPIDRLRVSSYSLKEGVLAALISPQPSIKIL